MAVYEFGGTPDSYVEDRDTSDRLAGIPITVLDGETEAPVTGLADEGGVPAVTITTDANGYFRFFCESPTTILRVVDSLGTKDWGPIVSPTASAAAVQAIEDLESLIQQLLAVQAGDHNLLTNRDLVNQHPIGAVTNLQTALDGKQDAGQAVLTSGNQTVGGIKTFTRSPAVPSNSFPTSAVLGLPAALTAPIDLTRAAPGTLVFYDYAVGGFGAAAGTLPAARPSNRPDIKFFFFSPVDPVAIMAGYDVWVRR